MCIDAIMVANVTDRGRHLYVFQCSTGRIKIGRSGNPDIRRRALQNASGRRITPVVILRDRGAEELKIHSGLSQHRGIGEWFVNTDRCRKDIADALGIEIEWSMPAHQYVAKWRAKKADEERDAAVAAAVAEMLANPRGRGYQERRMKEAATNADRASVRASWHK